VTQGTDRTHRPETEGPPPAEAGPGGERLSRFGRGWRVLLLATLTALFVAGSLKGNDTAWPFGPWRMFATSQATTGAVWAFEIQAETAAGQWFNAPLSPSNVGLNRAEIEGRIPQITSDPAMLGTLAVSHSRLKPHEPAWVGVRVIRNATVIVNRVPTGAVDTTVIATWTTTGVSTGGPL
jgi:hypothetical protein